MIIERGINSNCSETVYRFNIKYLDFIPESIIKTGSFSPMIDYSQMRPINRKEICIYYYQQGGYELLEWLEESETPYDTQQFVADSDDYGKIWDPLQMRDNEKEESHWGGSGTFYRRKSYDYRKWNKPKLQ